MRPRYPSVTGLNTRCSSESSAAASFGHTKALTNHEPSPPGREMICTKPEHSLQPGDVGIARAACPKPRSVSTWNEANDVTCWPKPKMIQPIGGKTSRSRRSSRQKALGRTLRVNTHVHIAGTSRTGKTHVRKEARKRFCAALQLFFLSSFCSLRT